MGQKAAESPVRVIGSRELHRQLPAILGELKDDRVRYVLTVHAKPRAVLIGVEAFLKLLRGTSSDEHLVGLQLSALLGGMDELPLDHLEHFLDRVRSEARGAANGS